MFKEIVYVNGMEVVDNYGNVSPITFTGDRERLLTFLRKQYFVVAQ